MTNTHMYVIIVIVLFSDLTLLPVPPLSERRYCDARCHAVCVSATFVSAAKVYPVLCRWFSDRKGIRSVTLLY